MRGSKVKFLVESMAFESGRAPSYCQLCEERWPYFQLMQSTGDREIQGRICGKCELQVRTNKWATMDLAGRDEVGESWISEKDVTRTKKFQNKGSKWNALGTHIVKARKEMDLEQPYIMVNQIISKGEVGVVPGEVGDPTSSSTSPRIRRTKKQKRSEVLRRANEMVMAFAQAVLCVGASARVFEQAGERMIGNVKTYQDYRQAAYKYEMAIGTEEEDACEEVMDRCEEAVHQVQEYTTAQDAGEQQTSYLKALDFVDEITDGIRIYNVCRAKKGGGCGTCGLAFPSKLWFQKGKPGGSRLGGPLGKKWNWKCELMWEYLMEEAVLRPESPSGKWFNEMKDEHGEDIAEWPRVGCGAGFHAFSNGPSMVVEFKVPGDDTEEWLAFMSERLPPELDDAIKGNNLEAFRQASMKMTAEDVYKMIPVRFPMTHAYTKDGKVLPGVAKYPIDAWEKDSAPFMSVKAWAKFCMLVAEKDMTNLHSVMEVCKKFVPFEEQLSDVEEEC